MKKFIILTLITILGAITVKAQSPSNDTTAKYFLIQASIGNLQEIASGKLAAARATSPDVKSFANMMVMDHSATQVKILAAAKANGIQLPAEATAMPLPNKTLKDAAAGDFDRLYVHTMVPSHGETVLLFENYTFVGKSMVVKTFAQATLPILKEHLAEIKSIDNKMKYASAK